MPIPGVAWLRAHARSLLWRRLDARLASGSVEMGASRRAALVVAPHQDDESFGCGGMIALKREAGVPVWVVFLTDGGLSYGADRLPSGTLVARRREEALESLAALGVPRASVRFLDRSDGTLADLDEAGQDALLDELASVLVAVAPGEVYVTYRRDGHPDHEAASRLVRAAIARSGLRPEVLEYPVWGRYDPRLLDFSSPEVAALRRLPIAAVLDRKRRAIACHRSQFVPIPPDVRGGLPDGFVERLATGTEYYFAGLDDCAGLDDATGARPGRPPVT